MFDGQVLGEAGNTGVGSGGPTAEHVRAWKLTESEGMRLNKFYD